MYASVPIRNPVDGVEYDGRTSSTNHDGSIVSSSTRGSAKGGGEHHKMDPMTTASSVRLRAIPMGWRQRRTLSSAGGGIVRVAKPGWRSAPAFAMRRASADTLKPMPGRRRSAVLWPHRSRIDQRVSNHPMEEVSMSRFVAQLAVVASIAVFGVSASVVAQTATPGAVISERVKKLTRGVQWRQVAAIPVNFNTFHPQGMVKIGDALFVSSVDIKTPTKRYPQLQDGYDRDTGE